MNGVKQWSLFVVMGNVKLLVKKKIWYSIIRYSIIRYVIIEEVKYFWCN